MRETIIPIEKQNQSKGLSFSFSFFRPVLLAFLLSGIAYAYYSIRYKSMMYNKVMFGLPTEYSFGILYIISQVFASVSFVFDVLAVQQKKKAMLLNFDTMAAFCSSLHYAFLGAWAGILSKIITTIRNAIAAYMSAKKIKSPKYLPLVFVVIYIVIGIFAFNSVFSILPILAPSIYSIAIYTSDIKKIRYVYILTNALWLLYDIYVFSIVGIITHIILVINGLVAVIRYNKREARRVVNSRKQK